MEDRLEAIAEGLATLHRLDGSFGLFGSASHHYALGAKLSDHVVEQFEAHHRIVLPRDYKLFLTRAGNGGAGPFYGLEPLERATLQDLDLGDEHGHIDPSLPFVLSEPWNMSVAYDEDGEPDASLEEEYFATKWSNGLIRLSNFGCGARINLVVNGATYGQVWMDDRCNGQGIFPLKAADGKSPITFLSWYEEWIDRSLAQLHDSGSQTAPKSDLKVSWWKKIFR